jgi:CubicO group peptidase (beta-lactamase class C family)
MKIRSIAVAVSFIITVLLFAQPARRVRGGPPIDTSDWPKITAAASGDAAIQESVATYLDALVQRDLFSGTVLLARNYEPVFFKSYAFSDRETKRANTNETKYNIGSINKTFTAVALRQLVDAGKIDFDKTLRTYLSDYPSGVADRITIRQMMEHRSGLGDFFGPEYMAADKSKIRSLADYVPFFVNKPLEFEPGASQRYSNAGYILLGLVVEKLSGMSYYDYVRTNIYEPAGMRDSGSFAVDEKVANRAKGYAAKERRPNLDFLPGRGSSAGGGYSTAMDLLRFVKASRTGVLTKKKPQGASGFAGGGPGINAMVEDTGGEWVVIVLSNYDPPAAEEVAQNVRKLLGLSDE